MHAWLCPRSRALASAAGLQCLIWHIPRACVDMDVLAGAADHLASGEPPKSKVILGLATTPRKGYP